MAEAPTTCAVCGRRMPQRKLARANDVRKYCSAACRSRKLRPEDRALDESLLQLLAACPRGGTVCPNEAAQAVFGAAEGLQPAAMERARCAARRLVASGQLVMLQGQRVVDPSTARGPVRVRLVTLQDDSSAR